MWHCSVASQTILTGSSAREAMARAILDGFGDAKAGEWTEDRELAFHLRRRLTPKEQERVGEALDCRTTEEGVERLRRIAPVLPQAALLMAKEEFNA